MRICSLIPGATEVVVALGLSDDLVGISHECDFPPEVREKPVMVRAGVESEHSSSVEIDRQVKAKLASGEELYALDEELFRRSQPDVVITQDVCHVCAVTPNHVQRAVGALQPPPYLVSLNPTTLDDTLTDVERIGRATGKPHEAKTYADSLRARLRTIEARAKTATTRPRVVCIEWLEPIYIAGHWVPDMVALAGGMDVLGIAGAASRARSREEILEATPDVLVLMPCGFTVERTLREFRQGTLMRHWENLPAVKNGNVFAVDASSYFSRPGPRLVEGVAILASLFHPSLFGEADRTRAQPVQLRSDDGD